MRFDLEETFYEFLNSEMISNETIRNFKGNNKKAYRILIICFYSSAILSDKSGFILSTGFIKKFYENMKKRDFSNVTKSEYELILNGLPTLAEMNYKLNIKDENKILSAISFFHKFKIEFQSNKKTLYLYEDIEDFWDVNGLYPNVEVLRHHWVELRPFVYSKPVLTFPEYFAYQDVINIWNLIIDTQEKLKRPSHKLDDELYRSTIYTLSTLMRNSIVMGVHLVETYLYYFYYNLKQSNQFNKNKLMKRNNIRKINDKEIVEELIFIEFPRSKDILSDLFQNYLDILANRDAFTHISAFRENHANISRLQRLININFEEVVESLQTIVDFLLAIENEVGEHSILFWRGYVEEPDFTKRRNISALMNFSKFI